MTQGSDFRLGRLQRTILLNAAAPHEPFRSPSPDASMTLAEQSALCRAKMRLIRDGFLEGNAEWSQRERAATRWGRPFSYQVSYERIAVRRTALGQALVDATKGQLENGSPIRWQMVFKKIGATITE